ncbi:MAG: hypothetical protein U9Q58_04395, partial [Pseudomonadota bacterium]|nr:hypothetical protein [Pseudomonadota bacterium]
HGGFADELLSEGGSVAKLVADLGSDEDLPLKQLGLLHEKELAALLSVGAEKLSLLAARQPTPVKADLLQLLAKLHGGFADELLSEGGAAAKLVADLGSDEGLPLKQLGLSHEKELAALLSVGADKLSLMAARQSTPVKADLLQLLAKLHGGFADELLPESGSEVKLVSKLQTGLRSLVDMVELNQYLNNPGLRSEDDLILLLPLWGWGSVSDLWLRLRRDGGEVETSAGNLYTMMLYLDLEGLGPLGAQVVVGSQELQVKLMVVGDESAQYVRELLPEARQPLRSRFPGGVGLVVESVGLNGVEAFRQRAFLASLPPLFKASG